MPLQIRQHERTGISFTTFGFGGTPLATLDGVDGAEKARGMVEAAIAAGVRYFDVAPFYGSGLAEHRMGSALIGRERDGYLLSTKVGRVIQPGRAVDAAVNFPFHPVFDYSYDGVMRSVEDSRARLGVDRIDVLYVHDVSPRWAGDAIEERFREVMDGGYRALVELRDAGVIKAFGVGINDASWCVRFAQAGDFDLFMLAGRYTLLDHSAKDELLALCNQRGIGVVLAAPFNSGILATGAIPGATFFYTDAPAELVKRTRQVEAVCAAHGVPLPAAALQFPLRERAVLSVVAGSRTASEVTANVDHLLHPIPEAFWAELAHEGLIPSG